MAERIYRGVNASERVAQRRAQLVESALDELAEPEGATTFGVRSVCRRAGLASRYFYESFTDPATLAGTVYDETVASIATGTLAAVSDKNDVESMARAGVDALVKELERDPRRARLLLAPDLAALPDIAIRRRESTRLFVNLLRDQVSTVVPTATERPARLAVVSEMIVGGVAQAIWGWLSDDIAVNRGELVDACSWLIIAAEELASASERTATKAASPG